MSNPADMLAAASSTDSNNAVNAIPRIIHQIWYQGEAQIPERYRRYRQSWQRNHPGWEFVFWDESRIRELIQTQYPWFAANFDGYAADIQRIDSVRYFILNSFGGFYVDMDIESFKPIDDLLPGYDLMLSRTIGFNNAIMGSTPGHPLWQTVFEHLREAYQRLRLDEQHTTSAYQAAISAGPRLFSQAIEAGGFAERPATRVCPGSVFEPDFPREENGKVVSSFDRRLAYARHYGDLNWMPPMQRVISRVTAHIFKVFWVLRGRLDQNRER